VDITTLGIGIDSRQVDDGKKALDDFTKSAGKAEQAAKGIGDGAKQGAGGMKSLEDSMASGMMKGMLGAQAIEKAVELAIDAVKQLYALMMEAGEYADLADMTGASAVNIAKLQIAADVAGISMQSMAGYMNQLTRTLSNTDEEGDKAARALARYGITLKDIKDLDPAQQIAKIGEEMGKYADSAQKTADMQAIAGRGATGLIKVIKVLSDTTKFHTELTEQMIKRTDDMSDAQAEFTSRSRAAIMAVSTGVVPGMMALKTALGDTALEMLGLSSKTDVLGANKSVETFVIGVIRWLARASIPFELMGRLIEGAISGVRALAEGSMAAARLDWSGVVKAAEGHLDRLKELSERKFLGEKFQANLDAQTAAAAAAAEQKKTIVVGETEAEIKARKEAEKELARIAKAAAAERRREKEKEHQDNIAWGRKRAIEEGQAVIKANEEYQKSLEEQSKMDDKNLENATKDIAKIHEKAQAIEEEVANHGKLKSAIEEVTIARLEDDLAKFEGNDQAKQILINEIEARKRLADAIRSKEVTDAAAEAAKKSQNEFTKAWEQVGQSLADELMKGTLDAGQLMKNYFKTLVLRPMIQAGMQGMAGSFMSGAAGGATGGGAGGGGIIGSMGSMAGSYIGSSLFGGVGTAAMAGYTGAAAGGAGMIGSLGAGAYAGLAAIPVAGWVALGAIAIYSLYKKFGGKGGGPKVEGSAGYASDELIGKYGSEMDPQALTAVRDLNANYQRMTRALGSTAANAQFGVGYSMDPRGDAPSMVHVRTQYSEAVNREAGRTAEELSKAMAAASATVMVDALRNSGMDAQMLAYWDEISEGMGAEAKLAAVEQVVAAGQYWSQLKVLGSTMKQFANISLNAAVSLAKLSGGVEALSANLGTYAEHFLNPAEQESLKYQQIAAQLNEAGSGWVGWSEALLRNYSKDYFRKVVEGLNLENEGDRMRYASLMKVAGAFAALKEAAEGASTATMTLAERQQIAAERYNTALDVLTDAYERQRDTITETRDAMRDATQSFLDFNASLRVDETLSTLDPGARMWELQQQYGQARQKMVSGGYSAEDVQRTQDAARALLQGGREFFGSGQGYTELFAKITTEMEQAAGATKYRGDIAENQLRVLESQVGQLVSVNNTLISIEAALREFIAARTEMYALGFPHAEGLSRVPFNNYPALLHKEEMVLPQQESNFIRGLPDFSGELRALRTEVAALRKENRQDAGNTIGATFTAAQQAAQVQSEATIRAARQRTYQSRSRPVLA